MKNDGFTTVDAVVAIALTGLLIAGMGPLFRAYSSDFPAALAHNREGMAFHHLSRDVMRSIEKVRVPYWSAGPNLEISENRLDIVGTENNLVLQRNSGGIRLIDEKGDRFYGFQSPPAWELLEDSMGRIVGIRLIHEENLRIDLYFQERALGAMRDEEE